jgi:flagellar biosynthesis anti-sigma factor FlgM
MKAASLVGMSTKTRMPMPDDAEEEIPASARQNQQKACACENQTVSAGAHEIARDMEQLKLAGVLISHASKGSEVRFEKVASLRQAIKAGKYRIFAGGVAEKLMDDMQPMRSGDL